MILYLQMANYKLPFLEQRNRNFAKNLVEQTVFRQS